MPNPRGYKNIPLHKEIVPKLERRWAIEREHFPGTSDTFAGYVNDLLSSIIAKDDFIVSQWPGLSLDWYSYNRMGVKDVKAGKTAEITKHDHELYCSLDDKFDCKHIEYAKARLEIVKIVK